ncbi:DUF6076 domain-containing protein [Oscillospiraceae bacterium OttesenSCG-928-F05]|nr:DUF6076 domain-containing protein [Oscillospiraceae bacterium OttesenSCG-928-F05]
MNYMYSTDGSNEELFILLPGPHPPVDMRTPAYEGPTGNLVVDFLNCTRPQSLVDTLPKGTGDYTVDIEYEPGFRKALALFVDQCADKSLAFSMTLFRAFMAAQVEIWTFSVPVEYTHTRFSSLNHDGMQYGYDLANLEHLEEIMRQAVVTRDQLLNLPTITQQECESYIEVVICSLLAICKAEGVIKRCRNCGLYFIPEKRADAIYCDRPVPQNESKTCKTYGARKAWETTLKENPASGLYRKLYMAKQMRVRRYPDIPNYVEDFERFKAEAKRWKQDIKTGAKTQEDYYEWLVGMKRGR